MQAIVLCGGKGTRLKTAIPDGIPKAMADINGKPFLYYVLDYWEPFISTFVLATGYGESHIMKYFGAQFRNSELRYVYSVGGTVFAVTQSMQKIDDEAFFVINGDTLFKVNPADMMAFHHSNDVNMTLSYSVPRKSHAGVDILQKNIIVPRSNIYTSTETFWDIGTPETLEEFRSQHRRTSENNSFRSER